MDKMVDIFQTTLSNVFSSAKVTYYDSNFNEVCSKGPIDDNSALVQVMAWRRTGDNPLAEPMLTQFIDTYARH